MFYSRVFKVVDSRDHCGSRPQQKKGFASTSHNNIVLNTYAYKEKIKKDHDIAQLQLQVLPYAI